MENKEGLEKLDALYAILGTARDGIAAIIHRRGRGSSPLPPTTPPPAGTPTDTPAFRLWRHMMDEHKLTLLDSELHEIIRLAHPVILAELAAVRAHSVERAEEYCRLHDELAALQTYYAASLDTLKDMSGTVDRLRQQLAGAEEANGELKETKELIAKTVREVGYILEARAAQQSAPAPLKADAP